MEVQQKTLIYAGFWRRFGAHIIDQILIGFVQFIVILPFILFFGLRLFYSLKDFDYEEYSSVSTFSHIKFDEFGPAELGLLLLFIFFLIVISTLVQWLYYALMESSAKQATVGKIILNLRVTDMEGNRISFAKATGRYFGKIISSLLLNIGYIMAAFTDKKQALHDIMANCLVLYDDPLQAFIADQTNL
ncbi:MAG: RDD family protein [Bacteroidota bacterium]|nr:RDD family protein [Bacteroidota bacterium]